MRVGIDATSCANTRGYGRFTREALRALAPLAASHELICLLDEHSARAFDVVGPNVTRLVVPQRTPPAIAAAAGGARGAGDLLRMTAATHRANLDVFFAPTVYSYFPLPPRLPALVAIHDAIAERFPRLTLGSRRAQMFWHAKVALACWQARLILTVSDYSARELSDVLRIAPARIRVATEAPSSTYRPSESRAPIDAVAAQVGLPPGASWFLYVGGLNPHKYVPSIIEAHARVLRQTTGERPYLVLAGPGNRDVFLANRTAIDQSIAAEGTADRVCWTGFLEDEDLRHLHSGALALLLVSASEGFGLPAVEAAACGTPVIATTESPLPELLAGGGIFVAPQDVGGIAAAMQRLMGDEPERQRLGAVAKERAGQLSWDRCARAVLAAIEETAR